MNMEAANSLGKPKMPVEMAGKAMEVNFNSSAKARLPSMAAASFSSSWPLPQTGPTAWMTYLQGMFPLEV